MSRTCLLIILIVCGFLKLSDGYKMADIPLYKKDTPYCMKSFRSTGDFRFKELWAKVPKHAKDIKQYRSIVMDEKTGKLERDDYWFGRVPYDVRYCPYGFNMTAIQIDLGSLKRIAGVVMLGQLSEDDELWSHYVSHYTVEFSPDGRIWTELMDQHGLPRHFKVTQHYEYNSISMHREIGIPRAHLQTFDPNIHARVIRLNIKAYVRTACVPFIDVFGCESEIAKNNAQRVEEPKRKLKEDECSYMNPLGMESGEIKDHQIEASSYLKARPYNLYPHRARWGHYETQKWCANPSPMVGDRAPWIKVRLSSWIKYVTYIRHKAEIVAYKMYIELSLDGVEWKPYKPKRKLVWTQPYKAGGIASNYWLIPPEPARYVRFRFTRSQLIGPYKVCLKFEIYGCSAETQSIAYGRKKTRRVPARFKFTPTRPDRTAASIILEGDPYHAWCTKYKGEVFLHFGDPRVKESQSFNSFRIDLTKIFAISRVVVQGDRHPIKGCGGYTHTMSVMHSVDEETWVLTRDYNGRDDFKFRTRIFRAINDPCGYVGIDISPTIYGRYFRFIPQLFYFHQCLRIVLVGYEPGKQPLLSQKPRKPTPVCNRPLGMERGAIRDKQISASSYLKGGVRTAAKHGRLKQNGGWCVTKMKHFNKYYALNDSLEIDLKKEHIIDGFATQGYTNAMHKRWVTGYLVHYSVDGISWAVITMREQERLFLGNKDTDSVVRHYLNPRIRARKIRFVPVTWSNWICMRVEIYGCIDGSSMESRLEEKLRDLESKKLALVPLVPGEKVNFDCGDYQTWGQTNYLKVNLDRTKSSWYQKAYNKDFPLLEKRLTLATNQFPNDFGSRHFMCVGRTRDGTEMFWQHLIAVQQGPQVPSWLSPNNKMKAMDSADIPQIIVIQRFDPSYDGGNPVWSDPATIYASGAIAQMAVYVVGIPFYPITIHNCLIENRLLDWHFSNLGNVPKNDYRTCAQLALSRGYEYISILGGTNCLSSWYLPLATSPHRVRDEGQCRLNPKVYFINATFEEYEITWYKKDNNNSDDDDDKWTRLVSYTIKPRMKTSPHIAMLRDHPEVYKEKMKRFSNGGYYQTFDKPFFGDTYVGSHVIEIMDVSAEDLGSYKFEVFVPGRSVMNEATIELRHEKEPQIELPELYEACEEVPGPITVKAVDTDLLDPEVWESAKWFYTIFRGLKPGARYSSTSRISFQTKGLWNETFVWTEPDPFVNGAYFEVFIENHYGFATGLAEIAIIKKKEIPAIKWITPTPFQAVDGLTQMLEVKLTNEKQLESVKWFHDGKPIEAATERYGLPESSAGVHKKLKLIKIDTQTAGKYKVVVQGKACRFERTVDVKVMVIPRVYYKPQADFVIAKDTDKEVVFNATVKGGNPKPKIQQMKWRKGSKILMASYGARLVLYTTLDENLNWLSVLKIRKLRSKDSGDYSFKLVMGPAVMNKSWRLSVRSTGPSQPTSNITQSISTPPPSAALRISINVLFCDVYTVIVLIYYFVVFT